MRKHLLNSIIIIIFSLLFAACGQGMSDGNAADGSEGNAVSFEGFSSEVISGGKDLEGGNLKTVSISDNAEDTVIELAFCLGSAISNGDVELELRTMPPEYELSLLGEPHRLKLKISGLDYTDFQRDETREYAGSVKGMFAVPNEETGEFILYFQLENDVKYKLTENGGNITVTLRSVPKSNVNANEKPADENVVDVSTAQQAGAGEAYYVLANEYGAFLSGSLNCKDDMQPTLAADGNTLVLISQGLSSNEKAEQLKERLIGGEENAIAANWSVIKLKFGELPAYDKAMDYAAAYGNSPYRIDGIVKEADPIIPDGIFLTNLQDGDAMLYSARVREFAGSDIIEHEQLRLMNSDGTSRPFIKYEFEKIASAKYSPDGRKLAVLELAGESAHLYVFDVDSRDMITDLSAVGFGDIISDYCWDSMGGRLFALSGNGDVNLHQYDFNVPAENKRHTVVDKGSCNESGLGFIDGEVYYCAADDDGNTNVYMIKPEGGIRRSYTVGDSFKLSGDGCYMAFTRGTGDVGEDAQKPLFAIRNLQTGNIHEITDSFSVYAYLWSEDNKKLYYFENKLTGDSSETEETTVEADDYPYTLWEYDVKTGENRCIADLDGTAIAAAKQSDRLYICYTDKETMGNAVRATYALDVAGAIS